MYIGSFCLAVTLFSRYLEEAAFSIVISLFIFLWLFSVFKVYYGHSFFYCFHFMSFLKDMFREFGFAICVSEISEHVLKDGHEIKTIEETMSIIHLENNHRKINTLEEIEILKTASSK